MSKINNGLMTSNTDEWYTPRGLYASLDKEFNFTLDPCCTKESAKCKKFYTKDDDGLSQDWSKNIVFMNPPYGREIKDWVEKAYKESLKEKTVVVALIPARTDTSYWHSYIFGKAKDLRFLKGRVKFEQKNGKVKNTAPFPSAIIVWGDV